MRECSLHFDFSNAEGKLDLNKAEALMEMALKLGIHTFNTYWDQEVYPEKEAEDQEFADQIHALAVRKGMKLSSYHFVGSVLDEEDCFAIMSPSFSVISKYFPAFLSAFVGCSKP